MCTYSLLYKNNMFNGIFYISTFHFNSGMYHTYSNLFYVQNSCAPTPPRGNLQGTADSIYLSANGKITCTNTSVNRQEKTLSLEAITTLHLAFHEHVQPFSTRKTLCRSALETVTCPNTCASMAVPRFTDKATHAHWFSLFPSISFHAPALVLPSQIYSPTSHRMERV